MGVGVAGHKMTSLAADGRVRSAFLLYADCAHIAAELSTSSAASSDVDEPMAEAKPWNNVIMQAHPFHGGSMKTCMVFHKEPDLAARPTEPPGDAGAG